MEDPITTPSTHCHLISKLKKLGPTGHMHAYNPSGWKLGSKGSDIQDQL